MNSEGAVPDSDPIASEPVDLSDAERITFHIVDLVSRVAGRPTERLEPLGREIDVSSLETFVGSLDGCEPDVEFDASFSYEGYWVNVTNTAIRVYEGNGR